MDFNVLTFNYNIRILSLTLSAVGLAGLAYTYRYLRREYLDNSCLARYDIILKNLCGAYFILVKLKVFQRFKQHNFILSSLPGGYSH